MRVLITGGLGFIGWNLANYLLDNGYDNVTIMDNLSRSSIDKAKPRDGLTCILDDVRNFNKNKIHYEISPPDVIVHLAAWARIQPSLREPVGTIENNVNGTLSILDGARICGAKVIYAGSSSAEGDPNINPYSASKFYGEQLCDMYNKTYGLDVNIARFFNVYGDGQVQDEVNGNLCGIFQKQYLDKKPLTIFGDGEQRRDFTHVLVHLIVTGKH